MIVNIIFFIYTRNEWRNNLRPEKRIVIVKAMASISIVFSIGFICYSIIHLPIAPLGLYVFIPFTFVYYMIYHVCLTWDIFKANITYAHGKIFIISCFLICWYIFRIRFFFPPFEYKSSLIFSILNILLLLFLIYPITLVPPKEIELIDHLVE